MKMKDAAFEVNATSVQGSETKTVVKARQFELIIDEPENAGGKDEGATPVEFVLAALAGCLNVAGHLIAKEMGIELRGLKLKISGSLNPSKLYGLDTEERPGFKGIKVELDPDTDADKETLKKWIEVVESRCPVSDNLANATPVEIGLKA